MLHFIQQWPTKTNELNSVLEAHTQFSPYITSGHLFNFCPGWMKRSFLAFPIFPKLPFFHHHHFVFMKLNHQLFLVTSFHESTKECRNERTACFLLLLGLQLASEQQWYYKWKVEKEMVCFRVKGDLWEGGGGVKASTVCMHISGKAIEWHKD